MAEAPLPESWTEEVDPYGRTYFCSHKTQSTQWERPAPVASSFPPPPPGPPPYSSVPSAIQQPAGSVTCFCTPRITFWVAAGLGWIVWVFAVAAGSDDEWFDDKDFAAGDDDILDDCDDDVLGDEFCDLFKAFSAMQLIASIVASVTMVVLMLTLFRPVSGGCCSSIAVGRAGGVLMAVYALFQLLAFVLVIAIDKSQDDAGEYLDGSDADLGATFGVAVVAFALAMLDAGAIMMFSQSAGDGPFYACFYACLASNNANAPPRPHSQQKPHAYQPAAAPPVRPPEPAGPAVTQAPTSGLTVPAAPAGAPPVVVAQNEPPPYAAEDTKTETTDETNTAT